MIRGTIARIGELAMRHGPWSQFATLDCTSSRRSTVMRALPRVTVVITEYQRDSSSKRPRSSVVFAARPPTRAAPPDRQTTDPASRASRPAGGACGAPGHRARHVVSDSYACKLTPAGIRQATIEDRGLTRGHSISAPHPCADSLRMKRRGRRVPLRCQHRGRFISGALSPNISRTRSPASTPDCCHRSQTGERAF